MKRSYTASLWLIALLFVLNGCRSGQTTTQNPPQAETSATTQQEDKIEMIFLHINDVYEIAGVNGGKYGNLARVAQIKKELLEENPNTYLVLSGDFLNPSVLGTLKLDGKPISGKQMVDVMNAAEVDFVTFGNHEFDIKEPEVLERIDESEFEWIASNTFYKKNGKVMSFTRKGKPLPTYTMLEPQNQGGETLKVGVIGITTDYNQQDFVSYTDEFETAKKIYNEIESKTDFVVALTHLLEKEDEQLAYAVPNLKLLMGGHDHENMRFVYGNTIMAKADANAKTAYIHRLTYFPKTKELTITSQLKVVDESVSYEPNTQKVIQKWESIADSVFASQGFQPDKIVAILKEPLEAREIIIRNQQTNTGKILLDAMEAAFPKKKTDLAVLGSGSVRLDDVLSGTATQYDILRMLPFGGKIYQFTIEGALLEQFLEAGMKNKGTGGYLQYQDKLKYDSKKGWLLDGKEIKKEEKYVVVTNDYILTGRENNMSFMKVEENESISDVLSSDESENPQSDIRKAVIAYLEKIEKNK